MPSFNSDSSKNVDTCVKFSAHEVSLVPPIIYEGNTSYNVSFLHHQRSIVENSKCYFNGTYHIMLDVPAVFE